MLGVETTRKINKNFKKKVSSQRKMNTLKDRANKPKISLNVAIIKMKAKINETENGQINETKAFALKRSN